VRLPKEVQPFGGFLGEADDALGQQGFAHQRINVSSSKSHPCKKFLAIGCSHRQFGRLYL
jgi:hypothetical protein